MQINFPSKLFSSYHSVQKQMKALMLQHLLWSNFNCPNPAEMWSWKNICMCVYSSWGGQLRKKKIKRLCCIFLGVEEGGTYVKWCKLNEADCGGDHAIGISYLQSVLHFQWEQDSLLCVSRIFIFGDEVLCFQFQICPKPTWNDS